MSTRNFYPDVFPGTRIDFSNSTMLPNSLEFGRASTGTYTDQNGIIRTTIPGEPRFAYNPETGESLGLLMEEARTNSQRYSGNMSAWARTGVTVTADSFVKAPDGVSSSYKMQAIAGNANHGIYLDVTPQTGTSTWSVYLKYGNYNNIGVGSAEPGAGYEKANIAFDNLSTNIQRLPNDWIRVTFNELKPRTNSYGIYRFGIALRSASNPWAWNATGNEFVYVWGAQVELGSFATSYIPTTTSAVTRLADSLSVPLPDSVVKSGRVGFTPEQSSNTYAPSFALKDSTSPAKPYVLELGSVNSAPVASVVYNSVRQGTTSIPALPATAPSLKSTLSFNFEPTTGAVEISSTASDDADSHVLALPAELSRPVPSDQTLDLLEVDGGGRSINLKEIYLWEVALSTEQLASVSGELRSIGQPIELSTGVNKNSDYADAGARPTLDLRFAERKDLFDDTTEQNLVTFSRGSIGTYTDENGTIQTAVADEPRFDHDPETGESLGLLVEESRTNNLLHSLDFSSTWVPNNGTLTAYNIVSPDGTINAAKYDWTGTSGAFVNNGLQQNFTTIATGSSITASCFVKAGDTSKVQIAFGQLNNQYYNTVFDLSNEPTCRCPVSV